MNHSLISMWYKIKSKNSLKHLTNNRVKYKLKKCNEWNNKEYQKAEFGGEMRSCFHFILPLVTLIPPGFTRFRFRFLFQQIAFFPIKFPRWLLWITRVSSHASHSFAANQSGANITIINYDIFKTKMSTFMFRYSNNLTFKYSISMIMPSVYLTPQIPFKNVYLNFVI